MAELKQNWKKFNVSDEILAQYNELIDLILLTESMDDDERQYWFDIMPSMTNDQIDRLYSILDTEKKKLEKLEEKYQDEIKNLNEKHLIEWQEFQMKDSKKKIKDEESKDKEEDAEDVLSMLKDL
jgi:vacuolar-type H+-ATPase subunit I/STV1